MANMKKNSEQALPKAKILDQIIISPNHEFIHQFHLGTVERLQCNGISSKSEPTVVKYNLAEKFKNFIRDLPSEAFGGSSSW